MARTQKNQSRNIRIPTEIHEQLKKLCNREGWLMNSFVGKVVKAAILKYESERVDNAKQSDKLK